MFNAGLILEGGGMRGIYTAGVLDYLMDQDIYFKTIYGVSAGACHASSYLSRQRGRALKTAIDYVHDKRYASTYSFLTTGDYFGVSMVYDEIPNKLLPFDYDTYAKKQEELYAVVTNCKTGQAEYMRADDLRKDLVIIRASSSLPLLSRMVDINGSKYLDGGISDSIPIARSMSDGNKKNLIILTRHKGYQKERNQLMPVMKIKYRSYPELVKSIENRHINYNKSLTLAYFEAEKGNAIIIQPKFQVDIGRLEKDTGKLKALYQQGYDEAKLAVEKIWELFS